MVCATGRRGNLCGTISQLVYQLVWVLQWCIGEEKGYIIKSGQKLPSSHIGQEGAERFQANTNWPLLDDTIWRSLYELDRTVEVINSSHPSKARYYTLLNRICQYTAGASELISQKIFVLLILCGLVENNKWLDYTKPGSEGQWSKLECHPWNLKKTQKIRLLERLSEERNIPQVVAEEMGCVCLKDERTLNRFMDVLIKDEPLYGVENRGEGNHKRIEIIQAYANGQRKVFQGCYYSEYIEEEHNHYVPIWVRRNLDDRVPNPAQAKVRLASDKEGTKLLLSKGRTLKGGSCHSEKKNLSLEQCQRLLNSNAFFWKVDVSDLAEDHLGLRRGSWKDPLNGVDLLGNDVEGFAYTYGDHIESRILVQQATDCFAFPCNQKSQIGLRDNHQYTSLKWKYITQYEAENTLLYHVLLNTRPR